MPLALGLREIGFKAAVTCKCIIYILLAMIIDAAVIGRLSKAKINFNHFYIDWYNV